MYKLHSKIIYLLMLFCFCIGMITVSASDVSVQIDASKKEVTISGVSVLGLADREISIQVLQLNKAVTDAQSPNLESIEKVFQYIDQTKTIENGNFQFKFRLADDAVMGFYNLRIWEKTIQKPYENMFLFLTEADIQEILTAVNNAVDGAEMKNVMDQYGALIELDYEFQNTSLQLMDKTPVYAMLVRDMAGSTEMQPFTTLEKIRQAFKTASILAKINQEKDIKQIGTLLTQYKELLGVECVEAYRTYTELMDNVGKEAVWADLGINKIQNIDKFRSVLNERIILNAFKKVKVWGNVRNILEYNKEIIPLDLTAYNQLANLRQDLRSEVDKKLANQTFVDLANLKTEFGNAIKAVNDEYKSINETTSTGGGGGGGSVIHSTSVSAVTPVPVDKMNFIDIDGVAWANDSIRELADKGILKGKSEGIFAPYDFVTREEYIKMLMTGFGLIDKTASASFIDVVADEWYYQYVASAQKIGVTNGMNDGSFGVGKQITRQEMAVLAYRVAKHANVKLSDAVSKINFIDILEIEPYAMEGISSMQKAGIISGVGAERFAPKEFSTRAQAAKIIYELLKLK